MKENFPHKENISWHRYCINRDSSAVLFLDTASVDVFTVDTLLSFIYLQKARKNFLDNAFY